ncbi:hypothetical protein GCM10023350_18390 [Nocardioides endophyticus]|uniref:Minor silk ampullate protein n=1 Tax=Nocardioides endophyticus TaxID=1353775 RepID=A0ABP8YR36_9ACTN
MRPTHRRQLRRVLTAAVATALVGATVALVATPAEAAARITVRNDRGGNQADSTYQTKLTLSGTGFQVVRGGFGGVYVMFGWVKDANSGSWKPSKGGHTGDDYRYIPDAENADANKGYLKFVAFPGSSTAADANAVLSASGGFSVDLTIPGPVFTSVDRDGTAHEVDCRKVTCGVITIGAHGVINGANETFTPVRFGNVYGDSAPPSSTPDPSPNADNDSTTGGSTTGGAAPGPGATDGSAPPSSPVVPTKRAGKPTLTVDRDTATPGHALAFTSSGLTPGEQVLAILDDGIVAIGPMVAGVSGEVAGLIQLPVDLAAGTHELRLTGAASGTAVTELFPVRSAETSTATPASDTTTDGGWGAPQAFLAFAALVFAGALVAVILRLLRRRRAPRKPQTTVPAAGVAP